MRYSIIAFSALIALVMSFGIRANVTFACTANDQCQSGVCNFSTDECVATVIGPTQTGRGDGLVNPLGTTSVQDFLLKILGIVTDIIGPVVVILMLVYVGFLFVTAQGVPAKISAARQALLWTVVGALILLGAKAIALGIQATVDALKV